MKERLKEFMLKEGLNAKEFSTRIGVQPSSISHILSGRNKPSIELVQKILKAFPDFDIQYFVSGVSLEPESSTSEELEASTEELRSKQEKQLEKVILLYTDGSFKEYATLDDVD